MVHTQGQYILLNTISGAVVNLTPEEYSSFIGQSSHSLEDKQLSILQECGMLLENNIDETALLRRSYWKSKFSNELIRIAICPTLDCNFACSYCYEQRRSGIMNETIQQAVLDLIRQKLQMGPKVFSLCWYGGEPLLCPEIIDRLSMKIRELCQVYGTDYKCTMISNGYLLTEQNVAILKRIGCSSVQITVDGPPSIHDRRRHLRNGTGTFARIFQGIQLLNDNGFLVRVRVNLDKENFFCYQQVIELFSSMDNVTCYPAPVTAEKTQTQVQRNRCFTHQEYSSFYSDVVDPQTMIDAFERSFQNPTFTCMAENDHSFVIDPSGYLYKCMNDVGQRQFAVGSVTDDSVCGIASIGKYLGRDPFQEPECSECLFLPLCYGRCVWEYCDKGTHACPAIKFCVQKCLESEVSQ